MARSDSTIPSAENITDLTAKKRYAALSSLRDPVLSRARQVSELTLPYIMPRSTGDSAETLYTPFQSVGARGVNNLAAKLVLALLPPGEPFFRLQLDDFTLNELAEETASTTDFDDKRAEFDEALNTVERSVTSRTEQQNLRTVIHPTLLHLVIAGNGLLYAPATEPAILYTLDQYVCKRTPEGFPLEIIVQELVSPRSLDPNILALVDSEVATKAQRQEDKTGEPTLHLFTVIKWNRDVQRFEEHQEIEEHRIPDSEGKYKQETTPWLPLRFFRIDGEDYGRGMGEQYLGDLRTLEGLMEAMVDFAANAAKILWMVDEGGQTNRDDVADAKSGDVVHGDAKDVTTLQMERFPDFKVVESVASTVERRLSSAFLLNSAVQRDAERVTAEEIRFIAAELEDTLGGVYALLAEELQLPLVRRYMHVMQQDRTLPRLPEKAVNPKVITGIEALGRNRDFQRIQIITATVRDLLGPEVVAEYLKAGGLIKRLGVGMSSDIDDLVRSEEEVQQNRQQRAQQQMAETLGPQAIQQMGQMIQQRQGQQAQQPETEPNA